MAFSRDTFPLKVTVPDLVEEEIPIRGKRLTKIHLKTAVRIEVVVMGL